MFTCVKNMRQDRNDAQLMSITGSLQNILTNYLEDRQTQSQQKTFDYPAVFALPSSNQTPSYPVISI